MLLFEHSSHHLSTSVALDDLLESLWDVEWTDAVLERLDDVYVARFLGLVSGGRDRDAMIALADHLGRVAHDSERARLQRHGVSYFDRWRLLREALERRVDKLTVPEGVLDAAHVRTVLHELAAGPRAQAELQDRLTTRGGTAIDKSQLSTLLKRLTTYELVERRMINGRNVVSLTELGHETIGTRAAAPAAEPAPNAARTRPVLYLSRSAAGR